MKYITYFLLFVVAAFFSALVPDGYGAINYLIGVLAGSIGALILSYKENSGRNHK